MKLVLNDRQSGINDSKIQCGQKVSQTNTGHGKIYFCTIHANNHHQQLTIERV